MLYNPPGDPGLWSSLFQRLLFFKKCVYRVENFLPARGRGKQKVVAMAENGSPENKRPRRSASLGKNKIKTPSRKHAMDVKGPMPFALAPSSIISFFNNAPPAKIACPLCSQMVPRYGINQHIDEVCQNRDDVILVDPASDVAAGPSAENGFGRSSPYFPKTALTPEKNPSYPVGGDSETTLSVGGQASPYFKKGNGLGLSDGEPGVHVVKAISLGRLSTKLSRRRRVQVRDVLAEEGEVCPVQGVHDNTIEHNPGLDASVDGSQKENQLPFSCFQGQHSPTLGTLQESTTGTLSGNFDNSTPVSFPLGGLPCTDLGLLTGSSAQQNTPDSVSNLCKPEVCSTASSKEGLSNLESRDLSSGEQDPLPGANETYHNQMSDFSALGNDMQVLPMEEHRDLRNTVMNEAYLGPSEEASFQNPSGSILESVLNGPDPVSDTGGQPYYLRNFLMVLQTVMENEDDRRLFNEEDLSAIAKFYQLSAGGQKLYVRLFQRKLSWIKANKIEYAEISHDLSPVIEELVGGGFLQSEAELQDLSEVLDLLAAPELKTLAKAFHLANPHAQKQQLLEGFLKLAKQPSIFSRNQAGVGGAILKRAKDLAGKSVRICKGPRAVFSRLLLLFSLTDPVEDEEAGSGGQSQLSTVLMVNMGRTLFPTYTVNRKSPIFQDRDDFLRYAAALHMSNDVSVAASNGNWKEAHRLYGAAKETWKELKCHPSLRPHAALPEYLRRFTVGWVYTRILSRGVEVLQRLHMYEEAVEQLQDLLSQEVYCSDSRGRWWDRLALNLHQHLKDAEKAFGCIRKGLLDPSVRTGHRLSLSQRVQRMRDSPVCKKLRSVLQDLPLLAVEDVAHVTIKGKLCPQTGMGKSVFIMEDVCVEDKGEDLELSTVVCSVEELALAHYKREGFDQGIHGEGSTFGTLYGLLMWDILFMDGVPDVFRNPYQTSPLDLYTDSFYENRREALESRLQWLHEASPETLQKRIGEVWTAQQGKAAALVSWDRFSSLQQAQSLASSFGGPFLSGVCRRLSEDLRHCRGGLPDLVVWRTEDRQCKLVEVKGPNDRLSHKQMIWLAELQKLGAAVEVCHVVAIGSKSKRLS
ncbi:fanconi-associated nuclease 1 [Elgaria multicarinata webbii]|uniref:fanconi-associated nuclease 1 n=1 Tax=Elgaria multicarinata webbii TaxID=159646 RepID=UPI002FCCE73C